MDNKTEIIKSIISKRFKSVREFSEIINIPYSTIKSALQKGIGGTAVDTVIKMCEALDININDFNNNSHTYNLRESSCDIKCSPKEKRIIEEYRKKPEVQIAVDRLLVLEENYAEEYGSDNIIEFPTRQIPLPTLPAAAGMGEFLDSNDYELIDIPDNINTKNATFAVRVSGDSMEPNYCDGDIVLVKQQPCVETGEIGIFILNGNGYIKKCGNNELISLNPKYNPIKIGKCDELRTSGKVIGKL